jgi:CBS domain-containing protein
MIPIKSIMSTDVTTVETYTPIFEALELLTKNKISGLPVIDEFGYVKGILSEKDVLRILIDKNLDIHNTVSDYMSRNVFCFQEDDSAVDVCKFFMKSHIRRVLITRNQQLIGIVSRRDIVNLISEAKSKISKFRYV